MNRQSPPASVLEEAFSGSDGSPSGAWRRHQSQLHHHFSQVVIGVSLDELAVLTCEKQVPLPLTTCLPVGRRVPNQGHRLARVTCSPGRDEFLS